MPIKILDAHWHVGHQYEMLKFPFAEWYWLKQYKRLSINSALRGNISSQYKEVLYYEPQEYDVAILHLDQECLYPPAWNRAKGTIYRDMNDVITDIPKIVIMHGTPHSPESPFPYCDPNWLVERLHEVIGCNTLVVNSYEAAKQWGMGVPIIHGLDPEEWFDRNKVPRVVTTSSRAEMDSYYGRRFLDEVKTKLRERDIKLCHLGVDYVPCSWTEYRTILSQSLIYFNPTLESPMPRSRTEAMLSGCCVLTTPHHDASTFIEHGKNGFLIDRNADDVVRLIEELFDDPVRAIGIGQNGKQTALQRFSWSRFAFEWQQLLESVIEGGRCC